MLEFKLVFLMYQLGRVILLFQFIMIVVTIFRETQIRTPRENVALFFFEGLLSIYIYIV